ncbi:c-type cytochrome biogenesis protein CcsB [Corynebacterium anserum]|uniref:C-type cytochrome biogenesis protein CcsB n=1 Tax=Corynebacterium anserum TaxID=2684406 RepID=A0A7G7YRB6_9CORY|nr:c-type cytochrome biogenesis protein CcsB [Corynebacterium anserum]MBC2682301.1 c-type cytochrome biogenesis protein CcsB [Corynebacterium anserum]QNH97036.1 c-type cytochrome biogenesis protein CcsB [Corynebacterium anserum]
MDIDQNLANFSDNAFVAAVAIYLLALAASLLYYTQVHQTAERRRERAAYLADSSSAQVAVREKVAIGAGGSADVTAVGERAATGGVEEADLPEKLRADAIVKRVRTSDKLGGVTQTLIWLAITVHAVQVILRGMAAHRFPWGNLFEYITVVSLFAMIISAAVVQRKAMRVMWPWLLTPVVALLFYAGLKLYAETAPVVPSLQSGWLPIHVSTVAIGAGIGLLSGMASLMYLLRKAQPKGKEKGVLGAIAAPLPDVSTLDSLAYRTAVWALPIFGLGVLFGAIWADAAWGRFWGWDPKETTSLIVWILYAVYLHARATPGWRGNKAAWINVVAFATMVFNLFFVNMVVSGLHSYAGLN